MAGQLTQFTKDRSYVILDSQLYKVEQYQYQDAQYFVPPQREGLPKYEDFAPETVLGWRSWHHGFGDLYYDNANAYYESDGTDASIQGQITLSPIAASTTRVGGAAIGQQIIHFQEFKGEEYAIGTDNVFYWMPGGSPAGWNVAIPTGSLGGSGHTGKTTQFTVVAPTASFAQGQYIYVPIASQYWVGSNASTWTAVGTAAAHFEAVGNRLWRGAYNMLNASQAQWTISNSADGATWQTNGIFQLQTGVATLNWLTSYDSTLYMMSTAGLASIDTQGNTVDLAPEVGRYVNAQFGQRADTFHGIAYIPSAQGLLSFNGSQIINPQTTEAMHSIGPDVNSWSKSDARGRIVGLAPYVNYLYGTMQSDSGNGYIVKYRDYPDIDPGRGWHPTTKFSSATMGAIKVSNLNWGGSTYPIRWVSAGANIYQTRLPYDNDNPLVDTHIIYPTTGTFTLPIIDDHIPTFKKTYLMIVADITNQDHTSVTFSASLNNDGVFNTISTISGSTGVFEFRFAPSASYNFAYNVTPRLTLTSTASNQTPVVRSIALHHIILQPQKGIWDLTLAPELGAIPNKNQTSATQLAALKTARNALTLVPFQDWDDQFYFVTIKSYGYSWASREPGVSPQFLAHVTLQDYGLTGSLVGYSYVGFSFVAA